MRSASPLLQSKKAWFNTPKSELSLSFCSYDVFILFDYVFLLLVSRDLDDTEKFVAALVRLPHALCVQPLS